MKFIIMFFALVVAYIGFQELTLFMNAPDKPVSVALKDFEGKGEAPANWLTLSVGMASYDNMVYSYMGDDNDPNATIIYSYYAVVSKDHPYTKERIAFGDKYEEGDDIPESAYPTLNNFTVLVKTDKWKTVRALPDDYGLDLTIKGMIINDLDPIESDEEGLLKSSFPGLDLDKVLILEEGRDPGNLGTPLLMIIGGLLVFLFPLRGFIFKGKKETETETETATVAARDEEGVRVN
jgi:hypothetical protein